VLIIPKAQLSSAFFFQQIFIVHSPNFGFAPTRFGAPTKLGRKANSLVSFG
jgi:hypothetical protein